MVDEGRLVVVVRERGRGREGVGGLRQCHGVDIAVSLLHLQLCVRERERTGMRRGRKCLSHSGIILY